MENCLQLADHWFTIISGIFTILLTIIATWLSWKTYILTKKDEQKTIAINELKAQTIHLKNLFLYQLQPTFSTNLSHSDFLTIQNVGGDCYNLKIKPKDGNLGKHGNPFKKTDSFISASSSFGFNTRIFNDKSFIFSFEDKFQNKYQQELNIKTKTFSNVKSI